MITVDEAAHPMDREPVLDWIARHPGPGFALLWAPALLLAPLIDAGVARDIPRILFLVGIAVVFGIVVLLPFRAVTTDAPASARRARGYAEAIFVVFLAGVAGYFVVWNRDQEFLYPLLAIGAAVAIRRRWALSMVSALAISGSFATGFERMSLDAALALGFSTLFAGAATVLVLSLVELVGELRRTRERLARAAVAEERSRISRDLHDLLGHTLSVIVVKGEAIRRLARIDPDGAVGHATDIETIGRQALTEIREAVTGYRSVDLGVELDGARAALAAAGIEVEVRAAIPDIGSAAGALLGWVVREGVTNVVRHANATRCSITVNRGPGEVSVEIADNGHGGTPGEGGGLLGLRARVEGAGGDLTAAATSRGFRLTATIPTDALADDRG